MWNFYRTRHTAGNICLVLFTAFLFTITVAPFAMVGSAEATWTQNISSPIPAAANTTGTITSTTAGYQFLIELAVTDPVTDFSSIQLKFDNGTTIISVYASDSAVTKTYQSTSAGSTYGNVYSLVYTAPTSFTLPTSNVVYGKVYVGNVSLYEIVLTLTTPPPEPSSGGGGGGGAPAPAPTTTTTTTETGTLTVVSTTGGPSTATLAVDTAKLTVLINSDKPVVIELTVTTAVTERTMEMLASLVDQAVEKSKELIVKTDDVQFIIPPQALQVSALTNLVQADPNTKVSVVVKEVTPASVNLADKMGVPENSNLKAVGKVFDFGVTATASTGSTSISSFKEKVKVSIPYTEADLGGLREDYLAAYRITPAGLVCLGGEVDKVNNVVWFYTDSFSSYTLMAKIASFADILSHWARNDIELMAEKGIVKGMTANTFAPNAGITRAQFAALLVKALGLAEVKPAEGTFKDVKPGAWYYGVVEAAAAKGLVIGFDGKFDPTGKITRQAMAVMVSRALKVGGKEVVLSTPEVSQKLSRFSDRKQIGDWAKNGIAVSVKEGIITGRTDGTFSPKANATRAEGTVMIKLTLKTLGKL